MPPVRPPQRPKGGPLQEDQHGAQHLAVVGEERDTRDGHDLYTAVRHRGRGEGCC